MSEIKVINEQEVLGKEFKIYGDIISPLFLAKDVAAWIEHNKPSEMLNKVDDEEKLKAIISHSGQNREMWFLTEYGLYEVLMQSQKPKAKVFKKEVKAILKQIRMTGGYIPVSGYDDKKAIADKASQIIQETVTFNKEEADILKRKAAYADQLVKDSTDLKATDYVLTLCTNGFTIGRNILLKWMRDNNYLQANNRPYQKYIDKGYLLAVIYTKESKSGGKLITSYTPLFTPKGQIYFFDKIMEAVENGTFAA
ncbi:BRO family protein [Acetobacterium woodii]|uniref:Putative phage-like DNA binding protein KilA n=1 Tax=Acetobacterium woodii (strain ATCC 29683 / DSM 1030 / JCM 2381 / KCTC 1655 / WB1) TaxID=931626 RepID=H6LF41_ACEWD|nr:BRO family protein [Acetobacterium woodii]AFA46947.1 putative phage-like DNA binding protein KilA [Acetobacterium woodii DSM 1030]